MREVERIAGMLQQTLEGRPYYGLSVLAALDGVTAEVALRRPPWSSHCIWDIVLHLTAELTYAAQVLAGTAPRYGKTWPEITDTSEAAWLAALADLKRANRVLVAAVRELDDGVLDQRPARVRGPYYFMLHGTVQHNAYHAGQISLLAGGIRGNALQQPQDW